MAPKKKLTTPDEWIHLVRRCDFCQERPFLHKEQGMTAGRMEANSSFVRHFYAEAGFHKTMDMDYRGTQIRTFRELDIRTVLNLPRHPTSNFSTMSNPTNGSISSPPMSGNLPPFLMSPPIGLLIYLLMTNQPVRLKQVILDEIRACVHIDSANKKLIFLHLITSLFKRAQVLSWGTDGRLPLKKAFDYSRIARQQVPAPLLSDVGPSISQE
ncbi:uncharacterized protein G2W53_007998 [Senna tora]|uniref:Uncharacterized protein n=1 Tax=Senna tora TaxID=362788 RepID=A0A835CE90_9FABA|nr:uncharacterized protein G2W53_007998 [Senna tora]